MPLEIPVDDGIALLAFFSATSKAFFLSFFFLAASFKASSGKDSVTVHVH